jgi:RimJ/RimL family protein N-acetyltransferase
VARGQPPQLDRPSGATLGRSCLSGPRVAAAASRRLQRELLVERGFHRLELEIYAFNTRALALAERVGYVREGLKRRAYHRHGTWNDAVLYGLLADDLDGGSAA